MTTQNLMGNLPSTKPMADRTYDIQGDARAREDFDRRWLSYSVAGNFVPMRKGYDEELAREWNETEAVWRERLDKVQQTEMAWRRRNERASEYQF